MYLFFDTETTGLPRNWKAPVNDLANWPRMIQLAFLLYNQDGELMADGNYIVKPDNFTIPVEASRIHGITTAKANAEGQAILTVLNAFENVIHEASFLVAHNMAFDEKIIGAEFLRNKMKDSTSTKRKICTMQSTVNFCKISGTYGYKWPKLAELHFKLFKTGFAEAHNAAADIHATAKCFWELKRLGKI
jgi:DNA polymerase III subunit epsilon